MARIGARIAARIALILMIGIAVALATTPARAGEPTPTPSPEAGGTATSLPEGAISIRVIEDLNADGVAQPGESGLAGWGLTAGCSDAIIPLTTDADGYAALSAPNCVRVHRQFGWFPTTPVALTIQQVEAAGPNVEFLLQNLGQNVMELSGEAIVAGVPARAPVFEPTCNASFSEEFSDQTTATIIVLGAATNPGCPSDGETFDITMNGAIAASTMFRTAVTTALDFVVRGDSMRVYLNDVDGAIVITGVSFFNYDCAVITPVEGFVGADTIRVFVLSHEAKSGCAAPGNTIIFTRNGENLHPPVPWEPGTPEFSPPLDLQLVVPITVPDTGTDVIPPDTGSAGLK